MLGGLGRTIEAKLRDCIHARYGLPYDRLTLSPPPRIGMGELACPAALDLGRKLKRAPREIAAELAAEMAGIPGVRKVEVAGGGYLNFFLDRAWLALRLHESISEGLHGRSEGAEDTAKIIVEHTNINPNKAAHIGHLRNAALGDSFVRCLRFLGHRVEVQNYLDNTGVQVADVVVGLQQMEKKSLSEIASLRGKFDYYCWDVYARVSEYYRQSEENLKQRSAAMQAIEAGGNPTAQLAEHVAMRIVRAHLATMSRINVGYDLLPRESEILHLRFWERAFALLKERGAVYFVNEGRHKGCWVMNLGERVPEGDDACRKEMEDDEKIIVRSDGTVTYVGKDIAYQLWKFGLLGLDFRYSPYEAPDGSALWITSVEAQDVPAPPFGGASRVYNVIDSRQAYLQNIVLQGLAALGYEEQARNSIHFSYEMVALTPATCLELGFQLSEEEQKRPFVEVAGRKGLGVKADDLLDTLVEKALAEVRSRHELSEAEALAIAGTIAVAALRYFLARFARNTLIAFDFREALSFDGETGPYVQYAVVRADNIFRKLAETSGSFPAPPGEEELRPFLDSSDEIWELVYQAARLPEVARQAVQNLEVSTLAKYAFGLAQKFNLFYHRHRILSEQDETRKRSLLLVADIVRRQMTKSLDLLGCRVPPKM